MCSLPFCIITADIFNNLRMWSICGHTRTTEKCLTSTGGKGIYCVTTENRYITTKILLAVFCYSLLSIIGNIIRICNDLSSVDNFRCLVKYYHPHSKHIQQDLSDESSIMLWWIEGVKLSSLLSERRIWLLQAFSYFPFICQNGLDV